MFGGIHGSVLAIGLRQIENEWVAAMTGNDHQMAGPIVQPFLCDGIERIPVLRLDQLAGC